MRHAILIGALGVSVLAHAAILGSTAGFASSQEPAAPAALAARLVMVVPEPVFVPPAAAVPATVAVEQVVPERKPRPAAKPANAVSVMSPIPSPPSDVLAEPADGRAEELGLVAPLPIGEERSSTEAVAAPATEVAPAVVAAADEAHKFNLGGWPRRGDIRFRVMLGERGFEVGEARHEWSHDRKRYRMSVTLETTGVVDLLRSLRYRQHSEGRVGPQGLQPDRFRIEQSGKKPEIAEFDWKAAQVTMCRGERTRTAAIAPGDQDVLSLWHQIGIIGAGGLPHELTVVSGRSAKPSILEEVGREQLSLPIGQLETLRVRARALDGKLSIDIWLARSYGMLPVRIRIVDDKGEVLDQQAVELRLAPPGKANADNGFDDEPFAALTSAGEAVALKATTAGARAAGADTGPEAGEDGNTETEMIELREKQEEPAFIYQ